MILLDLTLATSMSTPVYLPPELPPYLKSVYDLKSIVGTPSDDEVIGIHAVIRMAQKAVDSEPNHPVRPTASYYI